jgi:hypothetical protein
MIFMCLKVLNYRFSSIFGFSILKTFTREIQLKITGAIQIIYSDFNLL